MGSAARLLCAVFVLVSLPLPAQVQPGALRTIAGNGSYGYSGDNGPAWEAQLVNVYALAADAQGNLYIADSWNNRVRKLTPSGTLMTVAGNGEEGFAGDNGLATAAKLFCPRGLAIDAQGNLYIADTGNSGVRKVANGVITTVAGSSSEGFGRDGGKATSAQLKPPRGLAVDAKGNLYPVEISMAGAPCNKVNLAVR